MRLKSRCRSMGCRNWSLRTAATSGCALSKMEKTRLWGACLLQAGTHHITHRRRQG